MRKIRVLIVDDSVVIRRLLSDVLSQDPQIEVLGTAPNGRIALAKLPQLNPDLVTLDVEMPEMDGLETIVELRKVYPKLPVIMFSTLTERGAETTLDALSRGATDYVAKPANIGSVAASIQSVKDQLLPKIHALCPFASPVESVARTSLSAPRRTVPTNPLRRCEVLVIGSSTGGPQALATVLKGLPANFPLPIAIVQHMPPVFTRHLAHRLDQECPLTVMEASEGNILRPGTVLIAPGGSHMELERRGVFVHAVLHQGPPENSCRPAVDVLFRSAAKVYGAGTLGLVLTGMGQDGMRGAEAIVHAGGRVLTQDEATCVVWGMPRAVVEAGHSEKSLSLATVPLELQRLAALGQRLTLTC